MFAIVSPSPLSSWSGEPGHAQTSHDLICKVRAARRAKCRKVPLHVLSLACPQTMPTLAAVQEGLLSAVVGGVPQNGGMRRGGPLQLGGRRSLGQQGTLTLMVRAGYAHAFGMMLKAQVPCLTIAVLHMQSGRDEHCTRWPCSRRETASETVEFWQWVTLSSAR